MKSASRGQEVVKKRTKVQVSHLVSDLHILDALEFEVPRVDGEPFLVVKVVGGWVALAARLLPQQKCAQPNGNLDP